MGWLAGLFGRKASVQSAPRLLENKGYNRNVVGESYHHEALLQIAGGYSRSGCEIENQATLRLDDANPHDANAVGVWIAGQRVGHLSREDAVSFRQALPEVAEARCGAKITGGWRTNQHDVGDFEVRLRAKWPPKIES